MSGRVRTAPREGRDGMGGSVLGMGTNVKFDALMGREYLYVQSGTGTTVELSKVGKVMEVWLSGLSGLK